MKKSDLHREYARVIDMCEGTNVSPLRCVKICGIPHEGNLQPRFINNPNDYTFAVGIYAATFQLWKRNLTQEQVWREYEQNGRTIPAGARKLERI